MRKVRVGGIVAGAVAVAVVILILVLSAGGNKTKPTASVTPLSGCTLPSSAPTPNGKNFTTAPKTTIDKEKIYVATFTTSCGTVTMRMDPKVAPASVNNFVFLARQGYFDGTTIPRVNVTPTYAIIQAGSQSGGISGGVTYKYQGETPGPNQSYTRGVVAMANSSGPSTNGSQFFFVVRDWKDLPKKYSIFGKVEDAASLTNLDKMLLAKGTDLGQGLGTTPDPPIYILSVTITEQKRS
jgi:cyclophilin family peptidyl-prolyl cis-trans isomerase